MSIKVRRVNPLEMRQSIVDFFWRIQDWPYPTKDDYFRHWDWRYTSLSDRGPIVWIASDGDIIIGHISVYLRDLALDGRPLRAGVAANFRVDKRYQTTLVGGALASAPRAVVRTGELDLLLGYGTRAAHALFLGLGRRDLGVMRTFVDIRQWSPLLRRRSIGLLPLSPLLRVATDIWKHVARDRSLPASPSLAARILSTQDILTADRSHWSRPAGLSWDGSSAYFAARFSRSEFRLSHVLGIFDNLTGRLEGLVAVDGASRVRVLECDVNEAALLHAQAIELAVRTLPDVESVRILVLPYSNLARRFAKAGLLQLPFAMSEPTIRDRFWSAYWEPTHPLATALADTSRWNLWYGWSHH